MSAPRTLRRIVAALLAGAVAQALAVVWFRRSRQAHAGARRHFMVTQGGLQAVVTDAEASDAVVSVLMGGLVLDLRGCILPQRPARIEALVVMGGLEVLAPQDWRIRVDVVPLMGGVQDRRGGGPVGADADAHLVLTGRVVMGGVDIATRLPGPGASREPLEWAPHQRRGG